MKHINLKGSWVIKAPIDQVFKIISDFENMPKNFPTVAESLVITKTLAPYSCTTIDWLVFHEALAESCHR